MGRWIARQTCRNSYHRILTGLAELSEITSHTGPKPISAWFNALAYFFDAGFANIPDQRKFRKPVPTAAAQGLDVFLNTHADSIVSRLHPCTLRFDVGRACLLH